MQHQFASQTNYNNRASLRWVVFDTFITAQPLEMGQNMNILLPHYFSMCWVTWSNLVTPSFSVLLQYVACLRIYPSAVPRLLPIQSVPHLTSVKGPWRHCTATSLTMINCQSCQSCQNLTQTKMIHRVNRPIKLLGKHKTMGPRWRETKTFWPEQLRGRHERKKPPREIRRRKRSTDVPKTNSTTLFKTRNQRPQATVLKILIFLLVDI